MLTDQGYPGQNGDSLTLQIQISPVQVCHTESAFAAILGDASVVTSGHSKSGGESSAVQNQLKNLQQIQGTGGAFAAILADGHVVTWGRATAVGLCSIS